MGQAASQVYTRCREKLLLCTHTAVRSCYTLSDFCKVQRSHPADMLSQRYRYTLVACISLLVFNRLKQVNQQNICHVVQMIPKSASISDAESALPTLLATS